MNIDFVLLGALLASLKTSYENAMTFYNKTMDSQFLIIAEHIQKDIHSILLNSAEKVMDVPGKLNKEEKEALFTELNKLKAVRLYKERNHCGLTEAATIVNAVMMERWGTNAMGDVKHKLGIYP